MTALPGPASPDPRDRLEDLANISGVPINAPSPLHHNAMEDLRARNGFAIASSAIEEGDIKAALKGCFLHLLDLALVAQDNAVVSALGLHADASPTLTYDGFTLNSVQLFTTTLNSALDTLPASSKFKQCLSIFFNTEVAFLLYIIEQTEDAASRIQTIPKNFAKHERIFGETALLVIEQLATAFAERNKSSMASELVDLGLEIAANLKAAKSELLLAGLKAELLSVQGENSAALALLSDREKLLSQEFLADPPSFYRLMLQYAELNLVCHAPDKAQLILNSLSDWHEPELSSDPDYYICLNKSFALLYGILGDSVAARDYTREASRVAYHSYGKDSQVYLKLALECIEASIVCNKYQLALRYCSYLESTCLKDPTPETEQRDTIEITPDGENLKFKLLINLYKTQALAGTFDYNGAIAQAQKGIALFKNSDGTESATAAQIYFNLAKTYLRQGNLEYSEAVYTSIKKKLSEDPVVTLAAELGRIRSSLAHRKLGGVRNTVDELNQQYEELCNDPDQTTIFSAMCSYIYALALKDKGKPAAACEKLVMVFRDLRHIAADVSEEFIGELHVTYVECLLAQGRTQDAANFADAFLESDKLSMHSALNPWSAKLTALLGKAIYKSPPTADDTAYQAAATHLKTALEIYQRLRGNTDNFRKEIKWVLNLLSNNAQSRGLIQEAQDYQRKARDY